MHSVVGEDGDANYFYKPRFGWIPFSPFAPVLSPPTATAAPTMVMDQQGSSGGKPYVLPFLFSQYWIGCIVWVRRPQISRSGIARASGWSQNRRSAVQPGLLGNNRRLCLDDVSPCPGVRDSAGDAKGLSLWGFSGRCEWCCCSGWRRVSCRRWRWMSKSAMKDFSLFPMKSCWQTRSMYFQRLFYLKTHLADTLLQVICIFRPCIVLWCCFIYKNKAGQKPVSISIFWPALCISPASNCFISSGCFLSLMTREWTCRNKEMNLPSAR